MALLIKTVRDNCRCICFISLITDVGKIYRTATYTDSEMITNFQKNMWLKYGVYKN